MHDDDGDGLDGDCNDSRDDEGADGNQEDNEDDCDDGVGDDSPCAGDCGLDDHGPGNMTVMVSPSKLFLILGIQQGGPAGQAPSLRHRQ